MARAMSSLLRLAQVLALNFLILGTMAQAQEFDPDTTFQTRLERARQVMSDNYYSEMASMLPSIADSLDNRDSHNMTYTVFALEDYGFWGIQVYPPVSLVQYHVVPFKVDRAFLESPSMNQQKIDTLLAGHPLVVTTGLTKSWVGTQSPSLNLVRVHEWDIYNDGHLIVHGLQQFFDPQFQTDNYPWFSGPEAPTTSPTSISPEATSSPIAATSGTLSSRDKNFAVASFMFSCGLFTPLLFI